MDIRNPNRLFTELSCSADPIPPLLYQPIDEAFTNPILFSFIHFTTPHHILTLTCQKQLGFGNFSLKMPDRDIKSVLVGYIFLISADSPQAPHLWEQLRQLSSGSYHSWLTHPAIQLIMPLEVHPENQMINY